MIFGFTEEQISDFFLTYGVGAFILFMLFIIGHLAWESQGGQVRHLCAVSGPGGGLHRLYGQGRDSVVLGKVIA